jgi:cell division topological specificity factor
MNLSDKLSKLIQYFNRPEKTAQLAKERLQIIIAHERTERDRPDYLGLLQKDLLDVISKYVPIDKEDIKVELEHRDGFAVLELNVTLPQS